MDSIELLDKNSADPQCVPEAVQIFSGIIFFGQKGEVRPGSQCLQAGLIVEDRDFPLLQAVAFFTADITGITAVRAVPLHFQIIRRKTVLCKEADPPGGDLCGCFPKGSLLILPVCGGSRDAARAAARPG